MSIEKPQFIPINEVRSNRLKADINLPFDNEKKIGLNLKRAERMMQLGGIRLLHLRGDEGREKINSSATIVGVNTNGEALLGTMKTNKLKSFESTSKQYGESIGKYARWIDIDVKLYPELIKQKVLNSGLNVRDSNIWSKEIDIALRKGIGSNGLKHLLSFGGDENERNVNISCYLIPAAFATMLGIYLKMHPTFHSNYFVATYLSSRALTTIFHGLTIGYEAEGRGSRFSLFYGAEIDRAVALFLMEKTGKLAKTLDAK